ncbi:Gfo/Idh/MocA family protein [Anaerorhabdus sp.]|jgi:scyllo-inositol 2-dehydrogenase (NADP+)|uniref:Gfo/Idh/MocA family protein n=1 Tax=Anaerorhabdus sp. TaxID=1872524 RepID=UPI002FCC5A81
MRFGVVGTNFVSDFFMSGVKEVPEIEVTGVCSGRKENAIRFAEKYNIENVFDNYLEMIDSGKIDAIYLAVPNQLHYEMTIECMKRKIPTLTEKPFATNYREAKEMIEYSRKMNTYLHDGLIPLYTENLQVVKEAINSIGKLRRCVFTFGKYSSRYDAYLRGENPTTFRRDLSNGSMMDLGIYCLGDAVALFGKPKSIIATGLILDTGVDGLGTCLLQYDGFEVTIQHSKITDTQVVSEIQGEEGIIQIDLLSRVLNVWLTPRNKSTGGTLKAKEGEKTLISKPSLEGFTYQLKDFVENVKANRIESEVFPHQLTLDIMEVLTECRRQMGVIYPADERE